MLDLFKFKNHMVKGQIMEKAIGMVETRGIIGMMEAADVMLKAADVELLSKERIGAGFMTVIIEGEASDYLTANRKYDFWQNTLEVKYLLID